MVIYSSTPGPDNVCNHLSALYELSLSIGTSLLLQENCEAFAQKLMAYQGAGFFAVYNCESCPTVSSQPNEAKVQYRTLYTCPPFPDQRLAPIISTELFQQLQALPGLCLNAEETTSPLLPPSLQESSSGILSVFSVCQGQLMIVWLNPAQDSADSLEELELWSRLLDKFGCSVQTCYNDAALHQFQRATLIRDKRLAQAQHLESLELMAAGIAHDLGNILNPLGAYPNLLSRSFAEGTKEQCMLTQIQRAVDQAKGMMADLLALKSEVDAGHVAMPLSLTIRQYLTSAEFLSLRSAAPNVSCRWQLDTDSCVLGDHATITRILLHLVLHAFDALQGQGEVEIQLCDCDLSEPHEAYTTVPAGAYVVLSVRDSGEELPQEALARLFEPFFSKKKLGRSQSGLGLAVVRGLVQQLKGFVDIQTGAAGTSMMVYFPRLEPELMRPESMQPTLQSHQPLDAVHSSAQEIISQGIVRMPEEWLQEFETALSHLNTQLVEAKIEAIPAEYGPLREAIASLTSSYRYDILLELIQTPR